MSNLPFNDKPPTADNADVIGKSEFDAGYGKAGMLEFIDEIIVTGAAATTVTFGSGGDGELDTALDGDADKVYVIEGIWVAPATLNKQLTLRPNGTSSNQHSSYMYTQTSTDVGGGTSAWLLVRVPQAVAGTHHFQHTAWMLGGQHRMGEGQVSLKDSSDNSNCQFTSALWAAVSTNVTTLDLYSSSNAIGIGSHFKLYKRL